MKFGFLLMSIVSAITLSVLSMIFATGRIPGREPEVTEVVAVAETGGKAPEEALAVFSDKGKDVDDLINALGQERELYAERLVQLQAEEEEAALQRELLEQLKNKLLDIRGVLDEKITEIESDEEESKVRQAEAERKNLVRLAEVTGRMEPESAAKMLAEMEPERAAKILYLVVERKSAAILDAAVAAGDQGTELAAKWVEIIRKLKKDNKGI